MKNDLHQRLEREILLYISEKFRFDKREIENGESLKKNVMYVVHWEKKNVNITGLTHVDST